MIGYLRGILIGKQAPEITLDVNGVGYLVACPMTTIYQLPDLNQTVSLYIHTVVREDCLALFGFFHHQDRTLFQTLIKAKGVGPKLALTILSGMKTAQFIRCVQQKDLATLTQIPGVGKKTAERLLIDIQDHLSQWFNTEDHNNDDIDCPTPTSAEDAISALIALGYKKPQATRSVKKVSSQASTPEELIKLALQSMAVHTHE